jgi:hypothetical protein
MTDLPSSLGIEAVELVSQGGRAVTVRVTGRWRRRRAELRGQAMLVVDGPAGRQRFLAMPEPPSLTGAAPGTWRMSFSVPAELAASLPGRTFLQLGGVMVPLPIGDVALAGEAVEAPDPDPNPVRESLAELLEARRARSSELAAESARRRAAELAAHVEALERDLAEARTESGALRASIVEGERRLRLAEQHTHAERALRADLEQELTRRTREARHDLSALHERVGDLERELARMRRTVDEAQHLAAAAEAARVNAERRPAEPAPPASVSPRAELTRREFELDRFARVAPPPVGSPRPPERASDLIALRQEVAMAGARAARADAEAQRTAAVERELAGAIAALERQRGEIEAQRDEIEAQRNRLEAQRDELEAQRDEIEAQRRRSARAYEAIELVRGELRQLREGSPGRPERPQGPQGPSSATVAPQAPRPVSGAGPIQADQLSAALARLRERTPAAPAEEMAAPSPAETAPAAEFLPAQPSPPARPGKPWMGDVLRKLVKRDASAAGHLVLALLPAQRAADPHPVAYDLVLSDVLSAHVTVDSVTAQVGLDPTARPLAEVDFQLVGDPAAIARLIAASPLRRQLARLPAGRRLARVRGNRRRLDALDSLVGGRLSLRDLRAAGVEFDPLLALTVAALMIEPQWTAGERFTIAHRAPADPAPDAYLHVRDGRAPLASGAAPHGAISTVVVCASEELLGVLAGSVLADEVIGDARSLSLLLVWLERAQCG